MLLLLLIFLIIIFMINWLLVRSLKKIPFFFFLVFYSYMEGLISVLALPFPILFYHLFLHFCYSVSFPVSFPPPVSTNQSIMQLIRFIHLRNFDQQTAAQNTLTLNGVDSVSEQRRKNKYKNRTNWSAITFTCQK